MNQQNINKTSWDLTDVMNQQDINKHAINNNLEQPRRADRSKTPNATKSGNNHHSTTIQQQCATNKRVLEKKDLV